MEYLSLGYEQSSEQAFAYIEREYKDVKGRIELQRRVVEQLHIIEADASQAQTALDALMQEEASKRRIVDYLRKWLGDKSDEMPGNRVWRLWTRFCVLRHSPSGRGFRQFLVWVRARTIGLFSS